jgi:hypothetical protein
VAASDVRTPWWRGYEGPVGLGCGPLPAAYAAEWEASGRSFPLLAGLSWKVAMDAYAAARANVSADRWLDARFEDLVADPAPRFAELLDFMSLAPDSSFQAALAATVFRRERRDAFQRQLSPGDIALLDASLAGHLRVWGYGGGP